MSAARSRASRAAFAAFVVLVLAAPAVAAATEPMRAGAVPATTLASPASGVIQTVAGSGNGDGGPATSAPLSKPDAVAVDGAGNLYIAEAGANRIRLVSAATGQISTFAGSGTQGLSGDQGPATTAQLNQPDGVAVDTAGNVYIADTGNRLIRKVDPSGTITTLAGPGGLVTPRGLTYWNGNLYVADAAAGTIDQIRLPGGHVSTLSGGLPSQIQCPVTTTNPAYLLPGAVAFDSTGDAYVADTFDNCVREITDPFGSPAAKRVIGDGLPVSMGDGGPASAARVFQPRGVAVSTLTTTITTAATTQSGFDGDGNLAPPTVTKRVTQQTRDVVFVADTMGHKVRMIDPASGSPPIVTSLLVPGLNRPYQMTSGPDGSLYVADSAGSRVYKITPQMQETVTNPGSGDPATTIQVTTDTPTFSGVVATVVAGNGSSAFGGDGGFATKATLNTPLGMASDGAGNVYFADSANQRVRKINSVGVISTVAGNGFTTGENMPGYSQAGDTFGMGDGGAATNATFNRPTSVAVDGAGNVFIADTYNNAIREVTAANGKIRTVVGSSGTGAMLTYSLNKPYSVALDAAGNLYIGDTFNHEVLEVAASFTKRPVVVAGGGTSFNDGDSATVHALGPVAGVAVDASGTLYISDAGYNRIWAVSRGKIRTLAGSATGGGFGGDGGAATKALLKGPGTIAVDPTGNVFVADTANDRVRKVAVNGIITTIAGTGTQGFRGDGASATSARLALPFAVAIVGSDLWVADTSNNRIRAVGGVAESPTADFVKAAYHDFLNQEPPPATLEAWTQLLDAGASRYNFVLGLTKQPAWASNIVKQFYVNTLGRPGDPGGIAYWTNVITSGKSTVAQVAAQFYSSDEYYARVQATQTNPAPWVQSLYMSILNRPGNASDVAYWAGQTKSKGRFWVAYFFYQSPESAANRVWNLYCAGSVGSGVYRRCLPATGSYAPVLDRAPDPSGLSYWPNQVIARGDLALAASLASGTEYFAKAQHRGF